MKKFLLTTSFLLIIPILVLSIMFYRKYNKTNIVIDDTKELEIIKEQNIKEQELEELKETKKKEIERYNKVKGWNEEITSYLD